MNRLILKYTAGLTTINCLSDEQQVTNHLAAETMKRQLAVAQWNYQCLSYSPVASYCCVRFGLPVGIEAPVTTHDGVSSFVCLST